MSQGHTIGGSHAAWPRRGEIWKGYTPGQPDDPHQPRFLLVISLDVRNRVTDDVIVVPIFSRGIIGPPRVPIGAGEGGLPHDSVLFCDELTTIDRDFLESGPLGSPVSDEVLEHVVMSLFRPSGPAPVSGVAGSWLTASVAITSFRTEKSPVVHTSINRRTMTLFSSADIACPSLSA